MAVSVLEIVNHPVFKDFIRKTKCWRDQSKIKDVFSAILIDVTGVTHDKDKNCVVHKVARNFIRKAKSSLYIGRHFEDVKTGLHSWLEATKIDRCLC